MTSAQTGSGRDELDEMRATIATLTAQLDELRAQSRLPSRGRESWRRRVGLGGAIACAGLMAVGVAGATPTTSTTAVTFVSLTAPHQVLSATIAANKAASAIIIGGSTTVPADATTVKLSVTAKGTAGGVINFYPAGNISGASGQFLSYPSGNTVAPTTIEENVGQSGELTFANSGTGSAVVVAKVIAYSTQVTAGDINGVGGSPGQVLTNTGAGASWQNLPAIPFGSNPPMASQGTQGAQCNLGQVELVAGALYAGNLVPADGRLLSISTNNALFQLYGTIYGGNGTSNFALPNLRSAAPNGTMYAVCIAGVFP